MGRPRNQVEEKDEKIVPVEVKNEAAPEVKVPKVHYSLYAFFSSINNEGYKIKNEYKSEGSTVAELLDGLNFPENTNMLVNVTVKKNAHEIQKALAPHKARIILGKKSVYDFEQVFRGL